MYRIDADVLIPGRGDPVAKGTVVMEGSRITYAGPQADAPDTPNAEVVSTAAVMPGMWDCHAHFWGLAGPQAFEQLIRTPRPIGVLRGMIDAQRLLAAGFTSAREPGGPGIYLAEAINEGTVTGPSIYSAHGILSQTGGHADMHSIPWEWVRGHDALVVVDGLTEVVRAVRMQLRMNARLIKVCASGGVMSEVDHPIHQQFSDNELTAIVEEAGRAERVVAAHCHGKPGIMAALRAGAHTIEHGTFLDEEAADAMVETGAILVPTRYIIEVLLGKKDQVPDYAYVKLAALADQHLSALRIAIDKGVKMAVGSDIFWHGPEWGTNGRELKSLVEAGMTPLQAIEAATINGVETLGPQAPEAGILAEGKDADVITIAKNPLDNIVVLGDADNVTGVWKRGERVK